MSEQGSSNGQGSTDQATIRYEKGDDGIVTLVLDDPASSANTMNERFVGDLAEVLTRLESEGDALRGVVVTSAKKTFFAGGDLKGLVRATEADRAASYQQSQHIKGLLRRLETLPAPVVAAIGGPALGGGLELALACHHRVVLDDPKVKLGFPEVTLGLLPGAGGVVRTVRLIGLIQALTQLLMQGQQVRPGKALELGLVHELATDRDDLLAKARAFVESHESAQQPWDTKGYKVPGGTPSSPSLAQMLPAFPATLRKQLKGANYPAPHHILASAVEGLNVDLPTAFTIESRYFAELVCGQTSTNMIQALWFDLNRINAGSSRPDGVETFRATKVAVLGAGMMGAGIAYTLAKVGVDVVLKDVEQAAADKGKAYSERLLDKAISRGRSTEEKKQALLDRITATDDYAACKGCDVVIEAVFEDVDLKHRVFGEVMPHLAEGALLCSNTSTLPITSLAAGVDRPADFVGMHFFSPVDKMPLVELIRGEQTSDEALARAYDVVRQIAKTPVVVNDSRGFFTSRVFGTMVLEGAAMLGEGVPPMTIERAAMQAGFPAGPLTLLDEITLTLSLKIYDQTVAAARAEGREPDPDHPAMDVLQRLVDAGRTGKSSGKGFFDWQPEKRVWPGLADMFTPADLGVDGRGTEGSVPFRDVQERLLVIMAVETARCVEEGVLESVEDANIGSIMGIGFPPLHGGVLQYVDAYSGGVAGFVERARELAQTYGERFEPPALLTEKAVQAGSVRAALGATSGGSSAAGQPVGASA